MRNGFGGLHNVGNRRIDAINDYIKSATKIATFIVEFEPGQRDAVDLVAAFAAAVLKVLLALGYRVEKA